MSNQDHPINKAMTLASNIKQKLKELGISASRLARDTGVPTTTVFNWLNGQAPKNIKQLKAVAAYLHVSIEELVFNENPPTQSKSVLEDFIGNELYAGRYEVVLRRISK